MNNLEPQVSPRSEEVIEPSTDFQGGYGAALVACDPASERLRAEVRRLRAALDAAGNRLIEHDLEDDLDLEPYDHSDRCTGHVHGPCDCGAEGLAAREDTERPEELPREFLVTLDHGQVSAQWAPETRVAKYRDGEVLHVVEVQQSNILDTEQEAMR